jgi:hypothetical protein
MKHHHQPIELSTMLLFDRRLTLSMIPILIPEIGIYYSTGGMVIKP